MLFVRDNKGVCDMGVCVGCYHYAIKGILSCVIKGMCIYIYGTWFLLVLLGTGPKSVISITAKGYGSFAIWFI